MYNKKTNGQKIQILEDNKEIYKTDDLTKIICDDDIYHSEIDLSIIIRDECCFEIFKNVVDTYPSKPAITFNNKEYSYKEIDSFSNRLARYLRERDIKNGKKIGLILGKFPELYIAMLGIMKAGAAYVPIDSSYPKDRVKNVLENNEILVNTISLPIDCGFFGLYDNTLLIDHKRDKIWIAFSPEAVLVTKTKETQKAGSNLGKVLNDSQVAICSCLSSPLSMITEDILSLEGEL